MGTSYLAPGYACNHKCICCPLTTSDRLHRPLSCEEIESRLALIGDVKPDGQNHIVLSGGEPMLHDDFFKIVDMVLQKGFSLTVLSNASQCCDKKLVQSLRERIDPERFQVITAIHSSVPAIHDSITGVPGSLLDSLEGLDNLLAAGIPITIKYIFNRISLPTMEETFHYLEAHYPPSVTFQFCTMDYSGRAEKNRDKLFVSMDDVRPHMESVLDYLETRMSRNRQISIVESPFCMVDPYYWKYYRPASGGLAAYIAPNTDEEKAAYSVRNSCGAFYLPCDSCAVQKWCPGTWASALQCGQDIRLQPISATSEGGNHTWTN